MSNVSRTLKRIWHDLNPADPSPLYLVKLMAFMITCFAVALVIGQLT